MIMHDLSCIFIHHLGCLLLVIWGGKCVTSLQDRLLSVLRDSPGLSDRELTDRLLGSGCHQSRVNQEARLLEGQSQLVRQRRADGIIGNYPPGGVPNDADEGSSFEINRTAEKLSEDEIKEVLADWLSASSWNVEVAWGKRQGIDIAAERNGTRWLIEVKGLGSRNAMRVNYFLAVLGETLQRMDEPKAKYSIALPDVGQFRRLWDRLPEVAKERTKITVLFVSEEGAVDECT